MILLFAILFPLLAHSQPYSINWFKVAGGGGVSSNNAYTLTSTIGQQDAGAPVSGGGYSMTGGFWSMIAVQTPGAPLLSIALTGPNTALISWVASSAAFTLQQNGNLASTNWTAVTINVNNVNGTNQVTISPVTGYQFYRLKSE